jgi:hypothetical protein
MEDSVYLLNEWIKWGWERNTEITMISTDIEKSANIAHKISALQNRYNWNITTRYYPEDSQDRKNYETAKKQKKRRTCQNDKKTTRRILLLILLSHTHSFQNPRHWKDQIQIKLNSGYFQEIIRNISTRLLLQRHLHIHVYCGTIHNSQVMETAKMPQHW